MPVELGSTRALEVGPTEFVFRRYALRVVGGPDEGLEVVSSGEETSIGTERGNDLVLTDRTVSRHHVSIRASRLGLELRDLRSTNGTVLGGYRVMSALVGPGALIGLGRTVVRLDPREGEVVESLSERQAFGGALGVSPAMRRIFALCERFAASDGTVLVEGETGTGKELLAAAIHEHSRRAGGPFVVVDCGAIPPTLVESELFGHARGAFTGAVEARAGAFEQARGGTLFLDEIGELPLAVQPVLLRALEDRTFKRVGDDRRQPLDVRVVAATHRDLREEVNRSRFRADLFYRLAVLRVRVPSLRERREDVPLLVRHFSEELAGEREQSRLPDELVTAFASHDWPGNVRELRNAVQRAILLGDASRWRDGRDPAGDELDDALTFGEAKERAMARWEADYVRRLIERHGGNLMRASRAVGMSRNYLRKLAERYGMRGAERRAPDDEADPACGEPADQT
jgi:DNA-binding NtrC family response regulator